MDVRFAPPGFRFRRIPALYCLLLMLIAGWQPSGAAAVPAPIAYQALLPRDSADLRDRAEDAQRRFERIRVRHLPVRQDPGGAPCDDRVGRMCWWHETGGRWTPEPEDEEVREARETLLEGLRDIAREIPGDPWVVGQRVWYTGEAGRWGEALRIARSCGPEARWWCDALAGLSLHVLGRYPDAEQAFGRALVEMDEERAARWSDPSALLDGTARGYVAADGDEGDAGESPRVRRMWALSDPFHLVDGNDRWTEHHARRTVALIRSDAANPHGLSWGGDLEELLIRYGWEVGWDRYRPGPMDGSLQTRVAGHEHPSSRSWIPPGEALQDPVGADRSLWQPALAYAPSAYAPAYAPVVLPMEPVISVFPRAGGGMVGVRWRMPEDTTYRTREGLGTPGELPSALDRRQPAAGAFLIDPGTGKVVAWAMGAASDEAFVVEAPPGEYLISVEAWDPERRFGGRVREGLILPDVRPDLPTLSDLVLLEGRAEPASTEEVLRRARPDSRVRSGSRIRVAWEVTGLGLRPETLGYRLTVIRADGGVLRRAGEWLGLVDEQQPLVLAWSEGAPSTLDPVLRSVVLELADLAPGEYRLRLELGTQGRETVVREQVLHVFRPARLEGDPGGTERSGGGRSFHGPPPR